MLQFLTSLKDAPVANILALAGVLFILAAAGGHIPRGRQLDPAGRWLCGIVGVLLLGVASWIAVALIPPEPKKEVVPAPTPQVSASSASRTPAPAPTWVIEVRRTEPQYVDWGCEETRPVNVTLQLSPQEEFVSAEVVVTGLDKAKSQRMIEPQYSAATRTVRGGAEFTGLDRVFFNCPGGGHATVQLVAEVRILRTR